MKRKNEEMQVELSNLRQLYDLLRLRPEQEALAILRKIRTDSLDASQAQQTHSLVDFIQQGQSTSGPSVVTQTSDPAHPLTLPSIRLALDSPSSDPNSLPFTSIFPIGYDEPTSQRRRHASDTDVSARTNEFQRIVLTNPSSDAFNSIPPPTSIDSLLHPDTDASFDPRLEGLPKWTPITKDARFLTHLMNLWHKWEYSYYHYLDWDIFLDDLSSGCTDFCSELLVNAVLASASFHSSLVRNRSKPFGDSLITRFYREARRLWEAEEGVDSLTRVQAALALFMVFGKHGRDRVGYMFLQEACRLARTLGLFRLPSPATQRPPHIQQEKWDRARAVTAWALFNFQLMQYYVSIIRLFQPFTHYESSNERISSYRDQALLRTSTANKELRQLIVLHDSLHGWAATITIILHPLVIAVFGSLDEIVSQENPDFVWETNEAYRGLLTCLRGLSVITTYNFYSQSLFRLVTQSCQSLAIPLPTEITSVLDRFQSDEWTKTAASMVSSQYIADMRRTVSGMENARMDTIISRWDALTIKEDPDKRHAHS
ncbi:uncharacterized protein N0V89_010799 [Didymosphaeria variabile]|uniref:Xylanolytic transcriptional activator regulatory domain-containing protein n=1 Tax=Didymosphaeria variabile TaxID=1932322 RepID=A0A9W9C6H7_9PLEO|nr:uncharacterized protein N0V89_010799 [Didymosphaeria variabile]KAJ4346866.1 hypothetical protein N0V89_010799 [Didymosphaeria variabile]